jgi:hypothetical protein
MRVGVRRYAVVLRTAQHSSGHMGEWTRGAARVSLRCTHADQKGGELQVREECGVQWGGRG